MEKVYIIRYCEIHLKGKNKSFFENLLQRNISKKLSEYNCTIKFRNCRYEVSGFAEDDERAIEGGLKEIAGIHSYSIAYKVKPDLDILADACTKASPKSGSFRVTVNRAEKRMKETSVEIARYVGGKVLASSENLSVDLHNPDFTIFIDIRSFDNSYIYADSHAGMGGMPVGSAGKGLALLSGGIDSPVSSYIMARRGLKLTYLHFWSYPFTNLQAKEKVVELAKIVKKYNGEGELIVASLTKMQEAIHEFCDESYMITLVRRAMMRVAECVAKKKGCQCLVNGESLGQVASQTIESITVTENVINKLPVLRPLIGMDKVDIIDIAHEIGTYKTSILPFEDCCTVFLPKNPITRPRIEKAVENESKIANYDELITEIIDNLEIIAI